MPKSLDNQPERQDGQRPSGQATASPIPRHLNRLGGFAVQRVIGRGGMGTVYEAVHESFDEPAALKVLSEHVSASPQAVVRFLREAQSASQLHHENITRIFAQGEENGVHYYAMELVDGPSVQQLIAAAPARRPGGDDGDPAETVLLPRPKRTAPDVTIALGNRQSVEQATALTAGDCSAMERCAFIAKHVAAVADALHYAHSAGVVHRDIKPHNLILGSDGRIKITDFGLARLVSEPGVTLTGEMLGSPLYMSPEQVREGPAHVDHRTDIYSLGITLYEWLTLAPPFPGETRELVIAQLLRGEMPSLRHHDPSIPVDLETICLKAMEQDRRRRYQTAGEMRDDLRRFLDGKPIRARRAGVGIRLARFVSRHQLLSLACLAVVVALGLAAALLRTRGEAIEQAELAEEAVMQAQAAAEERDALLDSVREVFRGGLPLEISAPVRILEAGLPVVQGLVEGQAEEAADQGAPRQRTGADPSRVDTPEGIAVRLAGEVYLSDPARSAPAEGDELAALLARAEELRDSDPPGALSRVNSYLDIRPDDRLALKLRTLLHLQMDELEAAAAAADRIVELSAGPASYLWRGIVHLAAGRAEQALSDLGVEDASADPDWQRSAGLALALLKLGKVEDALILLDALASAAEPPVIALLARATALATQKDFPAAIAALTRVLEIEPDNADVLAARGDYYGNIPDFQSAAADYKRAIDIAGPSGDMNVRWLMAKLARRNQESPLPTDVPTPPEVEIPAPPDAPDPAAAPSQLWSDHVQDWFSERVWQHGPVRGTRESDAPLAPAGDRPP